MANDPSADLIYAILSLDSYNRGYGSGIRGLDEAGHIGDFSIRQFNIGERDNWSDAGFYAIAYTNTSTGEVVISYRGTDTNSDQTAKGAGNSDARYGYGIALGAAPGSIFDLATDQAVLAAAFYKAVTGKTSTEFANNVTLVGHSLGGGLAGFINATTDTNTVVFDNLPYDVSAKVRADILGVAASFNTIRGYFTEGEFLQAARNGAIQAALLEAISLTRGPLGTPGDTLIGSVGDNGNAGARIANDNKPEKAVA